MADIAITLSETSSPRPVGAQRVYTKARWADAWELREHLWCQSCTAVAAPQLPTAQLIWHYGHGIQFGGAGFEYGLRLELLDLYVKIEIDTEIEDEPVRWYGIVTSMQDVRRGRLAGSLTGGVQLFACFGLELLLARTPIDTSYVGGSETPIDRALTFNGEPGVTDGRNRSAEPDSEDGVYVFWDSVSEAELWTSKEIVRYLLARQAPKDQNGEEKIPFELAPGSVDLLADFEEPRVPCQVKTLKGVLDQVLDRRRLLSYTLEVAAGAEEGDPEIVQLRVFRFNEEAIEDGEDKTIPPNPRLITLDFDDSLDPQDVRLTSDGTQQFHQVIARGQPIVACFSVSYVDGTLLKGWTTELATDYNNAASGAGDYPDEDERDARCRRNRDWRAHDRLERVYSYFNLNASFIGFVENGEGGGPEPYLPQEDDPEEPVPFHLPGWRVLPRLPLKTDHDYSGDKIETETIDDLTPDEQAPEYRLPLVVFPLDDPETLDATPRWQFGDKLACNADTPGTGMGAGRRWSVSVRPQDNGPGIVLRVSGAPQHAIASGEFVAPDDSDDEQLAALDWQDMIATIAVQADKRVEGVWPPFGVPDEVDAVKTMIIDVPECQQHYVAPGTVIGIADGVLERTDGGYIRDDQARLVRIALVAFNWYAVRRQAFQIRLKRVTNQLRLGDLIVAIGPEDDRQAVKTPVTEIVWEMDEAHGDQPPTAPTTYLATGFAELDPASL